MLVVSIADEEGERQSILTAKDLLILLLGGVGTKEIAPFELERFYSIPKARFPVDHKSENKLHTCLGDSGRTN